MNIVAVLMVGVRLPEAPEAGKPEVAGEVLTLQEFGVMFVADHETVEVFPFFTLEGEGVRERLGSRTVAVALPVLCPPAATQVRV